MLNRIVGGSAAYLGEVPWQVGLCWRYPGGGLSYPFCGATIISRWHVVTAAHCTAITMDGKYTVLYGSLMNYNYYQMIDVAEVIDYPTYNKDTFQNDIAMLRLESALPFNAAVAPACLPDPSQDYTDMDGLLSGWGHTSYEGIGSAQLLKVSVPVASNDVCSSHWHHKFYADVMLCVKVVSGKDTCQGDSGGPLVVKHGSSYDLVGVVSAGYKCDAGKPGLYTRVTEFNDWIKEKICEKEGDYLCEK